MTSRWEAFAQFYLPELASRRFRYVVHKLITFGQLPFGEAARQQVLVELLRVHLPTGLEYDAGERSFTPFRVWDCDHRSFGDGRMLHQRALEVSRADPLTTGLDKVLRAVSNAHEAEWIDRGDVPCAQPTSSVNLSLVTGTSW